MFSTLSSVYQVVFELYCLVIASCAEIRFSCLFPIAAYVDKKLTSLFHRVLSTPFCSILSFYAIRWRSHRAQDVTAKVWIVNCLSFALLAFFSLVGGWEVYSRKLSVAVQYVPFVHELAFVLLASISDVCQPTFTASGSHKLPGFHKKNWNPSHFILSVALCS